MNRDEPRADSARVEALRSAPEAASDETVIGRVIDGRYRIVERLGEGGMGAVYVAEHLQLQKQVALKVIHGQFADHSEMAARFKREGMASAQIDHRNVVSATDCGDLPEGGAYLVMQLVRGPSLRAHLEAHGKLSWPEACRLMAQVADALVTAHSFGIVHRDLKPENVLLVPGDDGLPMVKVLDFGIAHVTAHGQAPTQFGKQLTQAGVVIGTPGYMPPEQAMGGAVDERADLYALGVMLFELIMGKAPFAGDNFTEIVTKQLTGSAPELKPEGRSAPPELVALAKSLLDTSPAQRPAAAFLVRDGLRALAQQATAGDEASLRWLRESGEIAAKSVLRRSTRLVRAMPNRLRFAAAGVAVMLAVVAWWALRGPSEAENTAGATAAETTRARPAAELKPEVERPSAEPPKAVEPEPEPEARAEPEADEPEQPAAEASDEADDEVKKPARRSARHSTESQSKPKSKKPVVRLKRALNDLFN